MKKYLALQFILLILAVILPITAYAQVLTREQMAVDEDLYNINNVNKFVEPQSIVIVPIDKGTSDWNVSGNDWYRGIYYFTAGRLGLGDIPFHYIILSDGTIIEGIKTGEETQVSLENGPQNPILIAYLNDNEVRDFDNISKAPITDHLTKLANNYAIKPQDIIAKSVGFEIIDNTFKITASDAPSRYEFSLNQIRESVAQNYAPVQRNYNLQVTNVTLPQAPVNPGDDVIVSIEVKNNSEYTLFKDSNAEFIASKVDNSLSTFYINGTWSSPSQYHLMPENSFLRPGATLKFEMKLNIPLIFGEISEEFQLTNIDGQAYQGTNFTIRLTVNRIEATVLEITETETGSLNVRDRASASANIKTTVLPGQRFIELSRTDNGWVQIDLGGGDSGWVSSKYVKVI